MAKKMRVQIMVEPELDTLLRKFAKIEGVSISELCCGILLSAAPVMEQSLRVYEASKQLNDAARNAFSDGLARVADSLEEKMNSVVTEFKDFSDSIKH